MSYLYFRCLASQDNGSIFKTMVSNKSASVSNCEHKTVLELYVYATLRQVNLWLLAFGKKKKCYLRLSKGSKEICDSNQC